MCIRDRLFARLRQWRDTTSRAMNVPAYVVMNNATLEALAESRPQTVEALLTTKGIGPAKVRQYGDELLAMLAGPGVKTPVDQNAPIAKGILGASAGSSSSAVVPTNATHTLGQASGATQPERTPKVDTDRLAAGNAELDAMNAPEDDEFFAEDVSSATDVPSAVVEKPSDAAHTAGQASSGTQESGTQESSDAHKLIESALVQPVLQTDVKEQSHYWTWRLLSAGFTPDECAAIRSISIDVVLDHALRAADAGLEVDARWFLADDTIATISRVVGPVAPQRIRPLLSQLPRGTRYEEVQLVLKSRRPAPPSA